MMDVTLVIIAAIVALVLYTIGGKAYRFYTFYKQVNKIPGPEYKIPLFGVVFTLLTLKKEERLGWFQKVCNQYKDGYVRIWLGTMAAIHIHKPQHVEVILRSNTQITKARAYELMGPWLGQGLLTATGPKWFHSRKLITPAFHFSILEEFSEVMIDKAAILNKCIDREIKIHGDKPFDIFELAVKCALDIICETAMGVDVHAQEEIDSEYIQAIQDISAGILYRIIRPWLKPDWVYYSLPAGKAFRKAVDTSHDLCTRVIKRKQLERNMASAENNKPQENGTGDEFSKRKRKAFLDLLMEANEKDENPMSTEELRDQTNTFMFAGHDTTGALVSWTLFCLGNEPDVQKKVHEELDALLDDADDQTTLKRLSNLHYLDRVIKETLRLYPSAPVISRCMVDDLLIGDYTVPKASTLEIQIYQLHRDAAVWPDPLRFDPNRFLPENAKGRHPYAYIPFSAGPRNCIGQKYASLEAKVILAQVLRKFSVKSVENHSTIKKHSEIILRPTEGIYVNMSRRS